MEGEFVSLVKMKELLVGCIINSVLIYVNVNKFSVGVLI